MDTVNATISDLYKGLIGLPDLSFPKKCRTCERVYRSLDEYLEMTGTVGSGGSGLQAYADGEHPGKIVHLYRNCVCGSTLVGAFHDRRDISPDGEQRRKLFDTLLKRLEDKGLNKKSAKAELLKVMHGEFSAVLHPFGITPVP